ncbi:hypothetical protein N7488_000647 [Penicillium malachiteum]|nr:hypothetical protein N7488_000647 [Penicillium malachiteum]
MSADEGDDPQFMAPVNGEPHPEVGATATPAKRKRSTQEDNPAVESVPSTSRESTNLHESLQSLLGLLLNHDSELQLLSCPFPTSAAKPRAKRAKTSGEQETSNVRSRVEGNRYNTMQEFLSDIDRASSAVIERNQTQTNGASVEGAALPEVVNRIAAFKKHMNSLIGQSFISQSDVKTESLDDDDEQLLSTVSTVGREDKQVLTMYCGNQSHSKQVWSSLPKSVKVPLQSAETGAEKVVELQEPLRDGGLPNGITLCSAIPLNLDSTKVPKRTFGEVFAPRSGLPTVEPRKRSRTTSLSWIDPFDLVMDIKNFSGERLNHSLTPFPSGQWVQYGGVSSSPSYWARVEKHNEDAKIGSTYVHPAASWVGDDTSTLQGVHSSFAPSFDSSNSVLQSDAKNMVWWGQRGAKRFHAMLSPSKPEDAVSEVDLDFIDSIDTSTLEEMVDSLKPKDYSEYLAQYEQPPKGDKESQTTDEALAEINNLIETLASYQNIRRNFMPSSSDNAESKETPASDAENPETPSDAERAVYESLTSKLVSLISSVPPYVVAKVNGDQLAELNVKRTIITESPDWKGTMEKDDYTLNQERVAALTAQANAATRASTPSTARPANYQAPHSAYNQRAFNANARLPQTQGGFQVPQQNRQPSAAGQYTPGYAGARAPSTPSQRPGYNAQQYAQTNPQYSQANNVPQFQRPAPNGYTPQPYTPRPGQPASYNTPQGRTPNPAVASAPAQRYQQYAAQTPSQGYSNTAAAAAYARSAAEQVALNKAQLAVHQARQSPSTPQPQFEARHSQEGSLTPGSKPNGTPIQS